MCVPLLLFLKADTVAGNPLQIWEFLLGRSVFADVQFNRRHSCQGGEDLLSTVVLF